MPLDIVTYWNPKTGIEKKKLLTAPLRLFMYALVMKKIQLLYH